MMSDSAPTLAAFSRPATTVAAGAPCETVERLLVERPQLECVMLTTPSGEFYVVRRSRFFTRFAGRLGHGRALFSGRPIAELGAAAPALVLPSNMSIVEAGRLALERSPLARYDDLVVRDDDGIHMVALAELLATLAELHAWRAHHDGLTGLANRRLLLEALERKLDEPGSRVGLLFIDLDDFKQVNDSLGHAVGDDLLVTIGKRLRHTFRTEDIVARLGGDEFVVLLADVDADQARVAADRARLAMASPVHARGRPLSVRCSVGVALPDPGCDAEDLLRAADIALYEAKRAGKGRAEFYLPAMHERAVTTLDLRSALPGAIARGEFSLVYQPIVELSTGAVVAVEALARWYHPERGEIPPEVFIPLAEETEQIVMIGSFALQTACVELARWRAEQPDLVVNINVSPVELQYPDYPARVLAALDANGIDGRHLVLELTETALIDEAAVPLASLRTLADAGIWLAIDDFGTGYSSLARLAEMPLHILKLAKRFADPLRNGVDSGIVAGIVALTESLGLQLVAEGIEDPAQAQRLRSLGCPLGQGYHFGRPAPACALGPIVAARGAARLA